MPLDRGACWRRALHHVQRDGPDRHERGGGAVVRLLPPTFSDGKGVLHFRAWFRDPGGPGGSAFSLSEGLTILFTL